MLGRHRTVLRLAGETECRLGKEEQDGEEDGEGKGKCQGKTTKTKRLDKINSVAAEIRAGLAWLRINLGLKPEGGDWKELGFGGT